LMLAAAVSVVAVTIGTTVRTIDRDGSVSNGAWSLRYQWL
jgi:hypothetical protein